MQKKMCLCSNLLCPELWLTVLTMINHHYNMNIDTVTERMMILWNRRLILIGVILFDTSHEKLLFCHQNERLGQILVWNSHKYAINNDGINVKRSSFEICSRRIQNTCNYICSSCQESRCCGCAKSNTWTRGAKPLSCLKTFIVFCQPVYF